MNLYRLRVSIMGIPKVYRIIEASGNCALIGSTSGTTDGTGSGSRASGKSRRRKNTSK